MKYVARVAFPVAFAIVFSVSLFAQEFSADVISRTADGKVSRSELYQTPDKERFDSTIALGAGKTIETHMIIDRRGKLIYLIEPQQKTILVNHVLQLASNAAASGSNTNPCEELMKMVNPTVLKQQFVCEQVGHESVNGRSAEKWRMESAWLGNGPAFLWVDSQVKTAAKWILVNGSLGELQNIKVGPQPASLFELPADYRRQDLPQ